MFRTYDDWRSSAPEFDEEPPVRCCVCSGDEDAPPCSEECDEIVGRVARRRQIARLYAGARRCVYYARIYQLTSPDDSRVTKVLTQANEYRARIRALRAA